MLILTIRTDKPEAEIGLFQDQEKLAYETWEAQRELAETLHAKIAQLLEQSSKSLKDLGGIVAFQGPGSFTGLRIGLTVANAFADSLQIPITATQGENWIANGQLKLAAGHADPIALPEYGAPVHITAPKK